ncbi:S46 family peptidase [Inhella gelatinilytica]|uniref:Dipeptidyl-peptidase n=1 Tax=Inhella gelatinilytica TaxID=2795030 RepID=A0A931NCH0_9BURK|nr:S46 family peptidase [Inhella gelatinilytica]MBH9552002.1 S46 family peptidase [Inhella gelatinilytica]
MTLRLSPLAAALALAALPAAHALEGMWLPEQLPQLRKALQPEGWAGANLAALGNRAQAPVAAVVSLGGCSASFVSPQGLVVTNHHCAYGSIQHNSTPQRDLLRNGFLAERFEDELPASPTARIYVNVEAREVTGEVLTPATQALSGAARLKAIEAAHKHLVAGCEQDAGHRCQVAVSYGGARHELVKMLEIRDVRLVHAPADMVGRFGGDTDNWIWPRHTGDYSFYRAYVGPDGKPADFNPANKPYQPAHHLKLAQQPLKEGDPVMVAGYPGRTSRLRLPSEMAFAFDVQRPQQIAAYGARIDLLQRLTRGQREAELRVAPTVAGLSNAHKNWEGQQASFERSGDLVARKTAEWAPVRAWVEADPQRQARWSSAFSAIDELLQMQHLHDLQSFWMEQTTPAVLNQARTLYRAAQQRALPDAEREPGFQARDAARHQAALRTFERRYDAATDLAVARQFLEGALANPSELLPAPFIAALGLEPGTKGPAIQARLQALNESSALARGGNREAWLTRPAADFEASDDPWIRAAVALAPFDAERRRSQRERAGAIDQARTQVMQARLAHAQATGQALAPDANGTLRLSFGQVKGRPGVDGSRWEAFTTLRGILDKHQGKGDFDAPAAQREAIRAGRFDRFAAPELRSVPVNFLATLDTTGGNSGSAVLNAKGELVGLLFDGTLDGVIAEWSFDPTRVRSICVDARYMLWQMTVVDKAQRLLREMGV